MDYTSTNNWYGWMHMYLAHMIKYCGLGTAEAITVATVCMYKSCIRALLYKQDLYPGFELSDHECVLSSNLAWIPNMLNSGIDAEALNWWLAHV